MLPFTHLRSSRETLCDGPSSDLCAKAPMPTVDNAIIAHKPTRIEGAGQRLPTLDGLRGIAILMVLIGHFHQGHLIREYFPLLSKVISRIASAGDIGVELFFVLSGFLITGILLDTKDQPHSLSKFYVRRVLRIFPLYYGALAIVLVVLPIFVPLDAPGKEIVARQGWLWVYLINFPLVPWIWDESGMFMFGHFWSLCVEEHFYLIWPWVVAAISPKRLFALSVFVVAFALMARWWNYVAGDATPLLIRWNTIQKIDGLAFGALIAIGIRDAGIAARFPTGKSCRFFCWLSCTLLVALAFAPKPLFHSPLFWILRGTLVIFLFGFILVAAIQAKPREVLHRCLSSRMLVACGTYSYGLYVIHGIVRPCFTRILDMTRMPTTGVWPLITFVGFYCFAIGVCFVLAYGSYHLFEKRFLELKRYFSYSSR